MPNFVRVILLAIFFGAAMSAQAAVSPISLAVIPPVQLPLEDFTVTGVRASVLWGKHRMVYGFDLGAVGNITETSFGGIAVSGIFNLNQGEATILGLQAAGITNINVNKARIFGLQAALGVNSNQAESYVVGLQVAGLSNYSPFTRIMGAQISLYNKAREVYGFQIGLINFTESLHGVQIGLLNFNTRGLFAVAPILNIGF